MLPPHALHPSRRVCQHYVLHRRAGNTAQRAFSVCRPIVLSAKSTFYTECIRVYTLEDAGFVKGEGEGWSEQWWKEDGPGGAYA